MKVKSNIVCIDAGFRNTGVTVWDNHTQQFVYSVLLSFPKYEERYVLIETVRVVKSLSERLATIIEDWQPTLVVAELPFGGARNARAGLTMALACATVISVCALSSVKLHAIRPQEIKKWVSGHGNRKVPKDEVIAFVTRRFGAAMLPKSSKAEHIADAMAALGVWKDHYEQKRS